MRSQWIRTACAAGAAVASLALPGCTHVPGVSNGSVSVCYRAIPVGRTSIHDRSATLIGVHRIAVDKVRDQLPADAQAQLTSENDTEVCVMAFHGKFAAGQVDSAPPTQSGSYALVLVSSRRLHLVAALVLDKLPHAFGGRTL